MQTARARTEPTEPTGGAPAIRPLSATFADPGVEHDFVVQRFAATGRTLAVVTGSSAASWLLLIPTDWSGAAALTAAAGTMTRALIATLLGVCALSFWRNARWLTTPRGQALLAAVTALIGVGFLAMSAARQVDDRHLDLSVVLLGTALTLFSPISLRRRAANVALLYAAFWQLAVTSLPTTGGAPLRLAANLAVAGIGAVVCAGHLDVSARRQHALTRELRLANGSLSAEVTSTRALHRTLSRLASEDELTGLANRRSFFDAVARVVRSEDDHGSPGSAILIDADRFKDVNDLYGHDVGDAVLRGIAEVLTGVVRDGDLPARLGGEEFAVYLPGTSVAEARPVAEWIRAAVAAASWPTGHEAGRDPGARPPLVQVTVSVGVAQRRPGEPVDPVLRRADQAMYRSKRAGGDQLVCDHGT